MTGPAFLNRLADCFRERASWLEDNGWPDVADALRREANTASRAAAKLVEKMGHGRRSG